MASVFKRGRSFFARFKDAAGVWRSRRTAQGSRGKALAVARAIEAQAERQRLGIEPKTQASLTCGGLLAWWATSLTNRSARNDRYLVTRHLVPRFGRLLISELTTAAVVLWLDDLAAGTMKPGSQRGLLTLLSRFCSWCTDRGYLPANPCRAIPSSRRPRGSHGGGPGVPWIGDDATVLRIFERLPEPIRYIWLLTNRAGLRCGEAAGLILGDLDGMRDGAIRVRGSYTGPLKEDKHGGKVKWVPAPSDLSQFLGPWLAQRRDAGAGSDDLAFPRPDGRYCFTKDAVGAAFRKVRDGLGLPRELTAHRSGRHSFASRLLASGAAVEEVSSALGHADGGRLLMATYNHHVRKTWSAALVAPMAAPAVPTSAPTEHSHVSPATKIASDDGPLSPPEQKARSRRVIASGEGSAP